MTDSVQRFACTGCGACCNRPPEVELTEAAALADVFVFRLMFRLYWLSDRPRDRDGTADFYGRKRSLNAFAARKYAGKGAQAGNTKYLIISAVALDTRPGGCGALDGKLCGIHERRPLGCRSVPLHYSRDEMFAAHDLAVFVATPGFACDTSDAAPVVVEDGRIIDPAMTAARAEALELARRGRRWSEAIVRQLGKSLPSLADIEANAAIAATTVSMADAWRVANEIGLISGEECERLASLQVATIEHELVRCSAAARQTLVDMRAEYRAGASWR